MIRPPVVFLATFTLFAIFTAPAGAQLATGNWTPAYGAPLVVQTTQSTIKYCCGQQWGSASGELDAAYGYVDGGALHLLLTGNMPLAWNLEGVESWEPVDIFLDTRPGGQNQLLPNNPVVEPYWYDLTPLTGLKFDAGLEPDWWFAVGGSGFSFPVVATAMAELPTAGGGAGTYLGTILSGASQPLAGGTNPFGVSMALNDSNTVGVTRGCGAWSGPEIHSGIELVIPLAAIGNPDGCVRVCAFQAQYNNQAGVHNQVLGPLPPGTCDLGPSGSVDFSAIPGAQWFSVCPSTTPARRTTWGALKIVYR